MATDTTPVAWPPPVPLADRRVGGVRFDHAHMSDVVAAVVQAVRERRRLRLAFANAEFVLEARRSAGLATYLEQCDLVVADGMSVVQATRLLWATPLPARITGTDFVGALCEATAEHAIRLAFVGGAPGVARDAAARLRVSHPGVQVVATLDGFAGLSDPERAVDELNAAKADVIMVCLGNPRQEAWIDRHAAALEAPVLFGNGGALDFAAGRRRRAPLVIQRLGAEWAWRLLQEPSPARIRRQARLPRFVALVLGEALSRRRSEAISGSPPEARRSA